MTSSHSFDWTSLLSSIASSGGEVLTELLAEAQARVQGVVQDPSGKLSFRLPHGRDGLAELVGILDGVFYGLERAVVPPSQWLGMSTGIFRQTAGVFNSCAPDICVAVAATGCAAL